MTTGKQPRYLALAGELKRAIARGDYPVGGQLPTEHALCAAKGVSRHTARAALQVLEDARLIARKPGLGSRVIASGEARAFTQPLGGLAELLQYARDARLEIAEACPERLGAAAARTLGVPARSTWLKLEGVRRAEGEPIAATSIYIADALGARAEDFRRLGRAVIEEIEARYGVSVETIEQTIHAEALSATDAARLQAAAGAPALRTIRRYYDVSGRLFALSDTRHPAERFHYAMRFRRDARTG